MSRRLPVIIAGTNCLSGVTSWADQLRSAMADHPLYDVRTLYVGPEATTNADIAVQTLQEAHETVREMAPAVVVPNYVWSLYLTGFEPGVRCVGMCHADSDDQYYRPLSWYEPAIRKYIAVSRECDERLKQYVAYREQDVVMLPYGVSIPSVLDRNYQTKPLRLIYAGRVTQPQKRVWDFLPLVENLLRAKVPFVFDIIGDGDEFAPLQHVMRTRIPAADVFFHSRITHAEMAAKWLNHDIFIQTSDFEGTSVSMLEAMAHGVAPVITAASSGIAGVVNDGNNGFVVPVGDMAAMGNAIARLATDRALLADTGRAAYRTAQAYSMDAYVRKFAQVLDQVAEMGEHVDHRKRYGIFSPPHPLLIQHQLIEQQRTKLHSRSQRAFKRLFQGGLKGLRRSKSQPNTPGDRQAA